MLSHKQKCIFLHIPKTAGQSVEHVFLELEGLNWSSRKHLLLRRNDNPDEGPVRLAHLTAQEYLFCGYVTQSQYDEYFKFCFVRNPWARLVSSYTFYKFNEQYDFKTFVFNHMPKAGWNAAYRHFQPQYDYVYNEDGECLVDFIGRFEKLQSDFNRICEKLSLEQQKLPHINKTTEREAEKGRSILSRVAGKVFRLSSSRVDSNKATSGADVSRPINTFKTYIEYYDDETIGKVAEIYANDVEKFDYEFDK